MWQSYCFSLFFQLFSPLLQISVRKIWQFHIFALSLQSQNLYSGTKTSRTNIEGSGLFCAIKRERVRPQYTTAPRGVWDNHPKGMSYKEP